MLMTDTGEKRVGDNLEMLVTVSAIFVSDIHF